VYLRAQRERRAVHVRPGAAGGGRMQNHAMLILCDVCAAAIPDQSGKEVFYQVGRVRYRFELCPKCLDAEMKRLDGHRGIPGFRKRAAIVYRLESADQLPRPVGAAAGS
jgi:hypothetical protein